AVVGRNAFAHESGIHQHGVLADRSTYEIIDANAVGQVGSQIVLGKHSGRHAFKDTPAKMGITVPDDTTHAAFARFKELADRQVIDFNVSSVTGGVDALGDVIIQVEAEGVKVSGRGVSTDVVEASARAYLNAVNKVVRVRNRAEIRHAEVGP